MTINRSAVGTRMNLKVHSVQQGIDATFEYEKKPGKSLLLLNWFLKSGLHFFVFILFMRYVHFTCIFLSSFLTPTYFVAFKKALLFNY
jgi:hypothetical protein